MRDYTIEIVGPSVENPPELMDTIADIIATHYNLSPEFTYARARSKHTDQAKTMFKHFAYIYTSASLVQVGHRCNASHPLVHRSHMHVLELLSRKDRTVYSKYLAIKRDIDVFLDGLYPVTSSERKATLVKVYREIINTD